MDPVIIISKDDLFDVQVNQVKLFRNFSLQNAIIAYWCMLFVGQFHFPKGGDGMCYLIQRYFMDHRDYDGFCTKQRVQQLVTDFLQTVAMITMKE